MWDVCGDFFFRGEKFVTNILKFRINNLKYDFLFLLAL